MAPESRKRQCGTIYHTIDLQTNALIMEPLFLLRIIGALAVLMIPLLLRKSVERMVLTSCIPCPDVFLIQEFTFGKMSMAPKIFKILSFTFLFVNEQFA
jgi:hypothetical protein